MIERFIEGAALVGLVLLTIVAASLLHHAAHAKPPHCATGSIEALFTNCEKIR